MILVDTSAWLDYFRGSKSLISEHVDNALNTTQAAVTGLIITELLQGTRNARESELLSELFREVTTFYEPAPIWRKAGNLSLKLKKVGTHIKTVDIVIATMALEYDLTLLTKDSDFSLIAQHTSLHLSG